MKILVVHNYYQIRGGEDVVFENEVRLLREHGHQVEVFAVNNASISGFFGAVMAALGVVFSLPSYFRLRKVLKSFHPDVVHVHNFFPVISPAVFYACRAARVPVVMTLHNYRIVCPTATLMHEGRITEATLSQGPWWALSQRVYRGSYLGTLMLILMIVTHRSLGTWSRRVDRFIVLTAFARDKFIQAGLPAERLVIKPNFSPAESGSSAGPASEAVLPERFALYVGRLSQEKGVSVLLEAWRGLDIPLLVVGDGPEMASVRAAGGAVLPLGAQPATEVRRLMRRSEFLVLPSVCYEGFPMTLVEAMACDRPALVSRLGGLPEIVRDNITGLNFEPGNASDLAAKAGVLWGNPSLCNSLGRAAGAEYLAHYTPEQNYGRLLAIYGDVIREQAGTRGR